MYYQIICLTLVLILSSPAAFSFAQLGVATNNTKILENKISDLESKNEHLENEKTHSSCDLFDFTSTCDVSNKMEIWSNIILAICISIALPISLLLYANKHEKSSGPLFFDISTKIFELISGSENKQRWQLASEYSKQYDKTKEKTPEIFGSKYDEIYRLKENLNKIGSLYKSKAIDKKFLFNTYGSIIIVLYRALKDDIEYNQRRNPEHCQLFKDMYNDAVKYWQKKDRNKKFDPRILDRYW